MKQNRLECVKIAEFLESDVDYVMEMTGIEFLEAVLKKISEINQQEEKNEKIISCVVDGIRADQRSSGCRDLVPA